MTREVFQDIQKEVAGNIFPRIPDNGIGPEKDVHAMIYSPPKDVPIDTPEDPIPVIQDNDRNFWEKIKEANDNVMHHPAMIKGREAAVRTGLNGVLVLTGPVTRGADIPVGQDFDLTPAIKGALEKAVNVTGGITAVFTVGRVGPDTVGRLVQMGLDDFEMKKAALWGTGLMTREVVRLFRR